MFISAVAGRQSDYQAYIVGLNRRFVRGAATAYLAALGTAVDDYISPPCIRLGSYRLHKAAARVLPVAGIFVNVHRPQTERAVIARRIPQRLDLPTAVGADKAAVIF